MSDCSLYSACDMNQLAQGFGYFTVHVGNGSTVGFAAESPEAADAWHQAGLDNGGISIEDPPGIREGSGLYLAYLRDPSGNKICALHRAG